MLLFDFNRSEAMLLGVELCSVGRGSSTFDPMISGCKPGQANLLCIIFWGIEF